MIFNTRKKKNQFSKVRFFTGFKEISAHIKVLIRQYIILGRKKIKPSPILAKMCEEDQLLLL